MEENFENEQFPLSGIHQDFGAWKLQLPKTSYNSTSGCLKKEFLIIYFPLIWLKLKSTIFVSPDCF